MIYDIHIPINNETYLKISLNILEIKFVIENDNLSVVKYFKFLRLIFVK